MKKQTVIALAIAALAVSPVAFCQSTDTGNSTLGITIGPEARFTSVDSSTSLTTSSTKFDDFTGTTNFSFKVRTSPSTGVGSITVLVTAFGSGGPAISDLSYTCTSASGSACSSSTGASTTSATSVVTFGHDAHSSDGGDSGSVGWTLVDRPATKVSGSQYTSTATFTISAT